MKNISKRKEKSLNNPLLYEELNLIYKELLHIKDKISLIETKLDINQILENHIDKTDTNDIIKTADNHKPSGSRSQ